MRRRLQLILSKRNPALLWTIFIFILTAIPGNYLPKEEKTFSVDDFDDHIPESELDRFLREALQRNDFRLAIRIYYLMVIKELSQRKLISWRKEKTNFDYLMELREANQYKGFRDVTLIFERIWYGERAMDEHHFGEASIRFKNFLSSLKS
jgi:hypothetical protein